MSQTTANASAPKNSAEDVESLKMKFLNQNEHELEELKEKELKSLHEFDEKSSSPTSSATAAARPLVDRSLKPHDPSSRASFYNFRPISIPVDLTLVFLRCAESNTQRNVETCGILAGKLVIYNKNIFFI